jgi:hypothetical protein
MLQVLRTPLGCLLGCPLGHPCLIPSYKFEPTPLDPIRTSVPVHIILVSTSPNPCHPTPLRCLLGQRSDIHVLQVQARAFRPRSDLCPCLCYDPNPCHPTPLGHPLRRPLGHPCLTPSYKFKPVPSGPVRTSILVHIMSAVGI